MWFVSWIKHISSSIFIVIILFQIGFVYWSCSKLIDEQCLHKLHRFTWSLSHIYLEGEVVHQSQTDVCPLPRSFCKEYWKFVKITEFLFLFIWNLYSTNSAAESTNIRTFCVHCCISLKWHSQSRMHAKKKTYWLLWTLQHKCSIRSNGNEFQSFLY